MESARILTNSKLQPFGTKATAAGIYADDQLLLSGREMFVDELTEGSIVPPPLNEKLVSKEPKNQPVEVSSHKTLVSLFTPQPSDGGGDLLEKAKAGLQPQVKGYEWIEMGVRRQVVGARAEEAEKKTESATTKETEGIFRDNSLQSPPADNFRSFAASPLRHVHLVGEYPAVDYPMNEDSRSKSATSELPNTPGGGLSAKRDSEHQLENQDAWRDPRQPGDEESDTWNVSHNLNTPGFPRRRFNGTSHSPANPTPGHYPYASFSNSHSDYNQNKKRNSIPSELGLELRHSPAQQGTWKTRERIPPDPQTRSEPELPTLTFNNDKRLQVKTQRSASIPSISIRPELHPRSIGVHVVHQCRQNSPLEGLLERAKERVNERHGIKSHRNLNLADLRTRYPPPSPSFPIPHSASLSDGDREAEEEVEVELTRYRALTVSDGWKEQLVDGDEDYKTDRLV